MERNKMGQFKKGMIPWNKQPEIKKHCIICNKIFKIKPYRIKTAKFCSYQCYWKDRIGKHFSKLSESRKKYYKNHKGYWKNKKFNDIHKKNLSKSHIGKYCMEKHPMWKGGKTTDGKGYILIKSPNHPRADHRGYIRRSHLIMEKIIGRYIIPPEIVHHKGIHFPINSIENRQDDRPENLQLFKNKSKHIKFHNSLP